MNWKIQPKLMFITVVIWIIFIGLCIKAGVLMFTFTYSLFKPVVSQNLYEGLNLNTLQDNHFWYYVATLSLLILVSVLKAYIFYLMIKVFLKINLVHPFSNEITKLISKIGAVAIQTGISIIIASSYIEWVGKRFEQSIPVGGFLGSSLEYIFMGAIVYAIAQVFKRGVEIQSENELTI
ncbi:DUF2975 domain-containing protein [Belliella aquatica]|nr:DUF2975 domain-containing protein [Belliella aquatica]MCH7405050.1 DUF2975 domain-containing protein [Belliella aquatica]